MPIGDVPPVLSQLVSLRCIPQGDKSPPFCELDSLLLLRGVRSEYIIFYRDLSSHAGESLNPQNSRQGGEE